MKEKNTIVPSMSEDDAVATHILFHYWDKWIDEMKGSKRIPSPAENVFLASYHAPKTARITLMFIAFEAGVKYGMELMEEIERFAKEMGTI